MLARPPAHLLLLIPGREGGCWEPYQHEISNKCHDYIGNHKVDLGEEEFTALCILGRALSADADAHLDGHFDHEAGVGHQTFPEATAKHN